MDTKKILNSHILVDALGGLALFAAAALFIAFLMGAVTLPECLQWSFTYPTLGP